MLTTPQELVSFSQTSKILPLKFPNSAMILDGEYLQGRSHYIIAKIQMPSTTLKTFLEQPLLHGKANHDESKLSGGAYPEIKKRNWRIDEIKKFIAINQVAVDRGSGQIGTLNMKIDTGHTHFVIIYLHYIN